MTNIKIMTMYMCELSGIGPCTATEMIPTIEMIPATEMIPNHHRNDPHHRNDTGGHHRNDPRNIGSGIKRTTKTGQQFSAVNCFVFFFFGLTLDNNCSKDAIHLCLLFLRIFFLYFCKKIFLIKLC